eukprot:5391931-Pyramimonas_sp.AAC.1
MRYGTSCVAHRAVSKHAVSHATRASGGQARMRAAQEEAQAEELVVKEEGIAPVSAARDAWRKR